MMCVDVSMCVCVLSCMLFICLFIDEKAVIATCICGWLLIQYYYYYYYR